jgi:hypothetical protein
LRIFTSVDPLAANYPEWGSYIYCGNNPMGFVDPSGSYRVRTDPTRQVIRTVRGISTIGYRKFPSWEGQRNTGTIIEHFFPGGLILTLLDENDSWHIVKDAPGAAWEVFTKTERYKNLRRRWPKIKGIGWIALAYSVYQYLSEYSDPSEVIEEYGKRERTFGPCSTEACVHERIRRIIEELNSRKTGSKYSQDGTEITESEEGQEDDDSSEREEYPFEEEGYDVDKAKPPR